MLHAFLSLLVGVVVGCKSTGNRTMSDQEMPNSKKRQLSIVALSIVAVTTAGFGGAKLFKFIRKSEADKLIDKYKSLFKKSLKNPDDEVIQSELSDVGKKIENMISEETDKAVASAFETKLQKAVTRVSNSRTGVKYKQIKSYQKEIAMLEAGEFDQKLTDEAIARFRSYNYGGIAYADPRLKYDTFDEFIDDLVEQGSSEFWWRFVKENDLSTVNRRIGFDDELGEVVVDDKLRESMGSDPISRIVWPFDKDLSKKSVLKRYGKDLRLMWDDYQGFLKERLRFDLSKEKEERIEYLENAIKQLQ